MEIIFKTPEILYITICLCSYGSGSAPIPSACSLEGLEEVVDAYAEKKKEESRPELMESLR